MAGLIFYILSAIISFVWLMKYCTDEFLRTGHYDDEYPLKAVIMSMLPIINTFYAIAAIVSGIFCIYSILVKGYFDLVLYFSSQQSGKIDNKLQNSNHKISWDTPPAAQKIPNVNENKAN